MASLLAIILTSVILAVAGQVFMKMGMNQVGAIQIGVEGVVPFVKGIFTNLLVIAGLGSYVGSTLLWLVALSRAHLNFVYPFTALTFVLVMVASSIIFKEPVTLVKVLGFALIAGGILCVAVRV